MLTFIGIAFCVFWILVGAWLFSTSILRAVRSYIAFAVIDFAVAIPLFKFGDIVGATFLLVMGCFLLGLGAWLAYRLRPRLGRGPVALTPNGALGIRDPAPPTSLHAYEADLDPPGRAGHRRSRRSG